MQVCNFEFRCFSGHEYFVSPHNSVGIISSEPGGSKDFFKWEGVTVHNSSEPGRRKDFLNGIEGRSTTINPKGNHKGISIQ